MMAEGIEGPDEGRAGVGTSNGLTLCCGPKGSPPLCSDPVMQ